MRQLTFAREQDPHDGSIVPRQMVCHDTKIPDSLFQSLIISYDRHMIDEQHTAKPPTG